MPTTTHPVQHRGSLPETHYGGFWIFVNQHPDGCSWTILKPHRFLSSSPIRQRWEFKRDAIADAKQFIERRLEVRR